VTVRSNRRIVGRFRQDEGALQYRLDMLGQADRGHILRHAMGLDRRLDVGRRLPQ
jgi:hypothetical protein